MVAITDKFGKASIDTDYAVATTVKTTRTAGATVLEAYDLSKFAPDTPVFFITYKKVTDPVTNVVSVSNQTGWKAIVNVGANTLTNLTLAPGYTDLGNDVDDFIECIPTSMWVNDLITGLTRELNPDGTHKGITNTGGMTTDTITVTSGTTLPAGDIGTADIANAAVTPDKWTNPYMFSVYRNAALTPGADVDIIFDTEDFDTNNNFSTSTGKYTAPVDGFYQFNACVGVVGTPSSFFMATLVKNTIPWKYGGTSNSAAQANPQQNVSDIIQLTAGDTVSVQAHMGSSVALSASSTQTYFSGFLVSKT